MTNVKEAGRETPAVSESALADMGAGRVAYVRKMMSDDVMSRFPNAPQMEPGIKLWALLNADGTPIVLADTAQAVIANAAEHDLMMVSVH